MKSVLIFTILCGVLVLTGCSEEIEKIVDNSIKINNDVEVKDNIYRNKKYGFEINFPGNLDKLKVEERQIKEEESIFGSNGEITLYFNYQLDKEMPLEMESSLGNLKEMSIFYFSVIPKEDWKNDTCEEIKVDFLCRQGKKIGENDKYVFESGFTSIEGAGSLCVVHGDKQKEFCNVDSMFNEMVKNNNLDFKIIN